MESRRSFCNDKEFEQPTLKSAHALDTLKITNLVHPEISTWRGWISCQDRTHNTIRKASRQSGQSRLWSKPTASGHKNVSRGARKIRTHDKHLTLIVALVAKSHNNSLFMATFYISENFSTVS